MNQRTAPAVKLFNLGALVGTPAAIAAIEANEINYGSLVARHLAGDWGDVSPDDAEANSQAVLDGSRLLSAYQLDDGVQIWIITEADRSSTTILLPTDY